MNDERLHNVSAEESVIGGLLVDATRWDEVADVLGEADFFVSNHRAIFRAIRVLSDSGKAVDVITVAEFLEQNKLLEKIGGLIFLGGLAQAVPSVANIKSYAHIVREHALARNVYGAAQDIAGRAIERGAMTGAELTDFAQSKIQSLSESGNKNNSGAQMLADVMSAVAQKIDALSHRPEGDDVTGLATGFDLLDKMTTGFQPGDLVILAARPSMGKTALALNIAEHVGVLKKKPVLIFSLEMINEQLGLRLMSGLSGIPAQRVRVGRIYNDEWARVTEAMVKAQDSPIYLDEDASITPTELRARARRIHRECGGLALIVIDYLQLMNIEGSSDNRANELAKVSRGLKHLAKELQCPVIALSQLNRGLEARPNKRPIMSDLRDSGAIEQDADTVLFIYRDEVYNEDSPDKGLAEIIIGKQRNGPTGKVVVTFVPHLTRFIHRDSAVLPSAVQRNTSREKRAGKFREKNDFSGENYVDV